MLTCPSAPSRYLTCLILSFSNFLLPFCLLNECCLLNPFCCLWQNCGWGPLAESLCHAAPSHYALSLIGRVFPLPYFLWHSLFSSFPEGGGVRIDFFYLFDGLSFIVQRVVRYSPLALAESCCFVFSYEGLDHLAVISDLPKDLRISLMESSGLKAWSFCHLPF